MKTRYRNGAVLAVLIALIGWQVYERLSQTPTDRAYEICRACGLDDAEIAQMIDDTRQARLSPAELGRRYAEIFQADAGRQPCKPCAGAVLKVVEGTLGD